MTGVQLQLGMETVVQNSTMCPPLPAHHLHLEGLVGTEELLKYFRRVKSGGTNLDTIPANFKSVSSDLCITRVQTRDLEIESWGDEH